MTAAYPLAWPEGWPRTDWRKRQATRFHSSQQQYNQQGQPTYRQTRDLTLAGARRRLMDELDRLGARYVTLSTNVEVTRDGTPYSGRKAPPDPGVAVYFQMGERPMVLACDKWDTVAGNVAAIAGHIDAMRRQERYGVGSTERAFAGYEALPPPRSSDIEKPWREIFAIAGMDDLDKTDILAIVEARYKKQVREAHPDSGGTHDVIVALNRAVARAREELR